MLGLLLFTIGPMLMSLGYSFTNLSFSGKWSFVGLENYRNMFSGNDIYFYQALKVTGEYVLLSVPMKITYAFLLAILPTSQWIYDKDNVVPTLAMMSVWTTGGIMVVFLAGLQDIPTHLFEAIELDGGGALAKFRHITVPLMTPTIFFNLCTTLIGSFQVFFIGQRYIIEGISVTGIKK